MTRKRLWTVSYRYRGGKAQLLNSTRSSGLCRGTAQPLALHHPAVMLGKHGAWTLDSQVGTVTWSDQRAVLLPGNAPHFLSCMPHNSALRPVCSSIMLHISFWRKGLLLADILLPGHRMFKVQRPFCLTSKLFLISKCSICKPTVYTQGYTTISQGQRSCKDQRHSTGGRYMLVSGSNSGTSYGPPAFHEWFLTTAGCGPRSRCLCSSYSIE